MGSTEAPGDNFEARLLAVDERKYGDDYKAHLLRQYVLCVEMADKNSYRRMIANDFFLSLNSILITVIGIMSNLGTSFAVVSFWWVIIASLAGIILCLCWNTIIRSYRELSSAKFKVINTIERRLPVAAFAMEWEYLNPKNKTTKYLRLSMIERWVPVVFAILYSGLIITSVVLANQLLAN